MVEFFPPSDSHVGADSEAAPTRLETFSEEFACVECGISFDEITPQSFSFNNPAGMCPGCSGLGTIRAADPDLIVPDKERSIRAGAIVPWGNASELGDQLSRLDLFISRASCQPVCILCQRLGRIFDTRYKRAVSRAFGS